LELAKLATLAEERASEQTGDGNAEIAAALAAGAADALRTHQRAQAYQDLRSSAPPPGDDSGADLRLRRIAEHLAKPSPVRIGKLRA
jgi:hypothetical protein